MAVSKTRAVKIIRALAYYMEQNNKPSTISGYRIRKDLDIRVTVVNKDIEQSKAAIALQYKMSTSKLSGDVLVLGSRGNNGGEYMYMPNVARLKLSMPRFTFAEMDDIVFPYQLQIEFLDKDDVFYCGAGELIQSMRELSRNHPQLKGDPKYREAVHLYGKYFITEAANGEKYMLWMEMMRRVGIIDHILTPAGGMYPIAAQGDYIYFEILQGDYGKFKESYPKSHYFGNFTLDGFGTLLTSKRGDVISLESGSMNCEALGFVKFSYRTDLLRENIWSIL